MFVFIYIILVFLIVRFSVTLFNFLSNPKLGKYVKHFTDKVTVVVNADMPQRGLWPLLDSLKQHDYQHLEVLINCGAIEENEEIARPFCTEDARFRLLKAKIADPDGNPQPDLAAEITGDYILFLDTDAMIQPGFINSILYRLKVFGLTVLTIIPTQRPTTFMQQLLLPLNDFVLLNLFPLRLVRLFASPAFSASSDKCMFLPTSSFLKYNWHPGREIVKLVKMENLKAETLLGDRLIFISSPQDKNMLHQCGKDLLLLFGNNVIAALVYLFLLVAGPLFMLANAEYQLLIMPIGLIYLTRMMVSFMVKQNPLINVLLHPIQMILLCITLSNAIFARILTIIRQ